MNESRQELINATKKEIGDIIRRFTAAEAFINTDYKDYQTIYDALLTAHSKATSVLAAIKAIKIVDLFLEEGQKIKEK